MPVVRESVQASGQSADKDEDADSVILSAGACSRSVFNLGGTLAIRTAEGKARRGFDFLRL